MVVGWSYRVIELAEALAPTVGHHLTPAPTVSVFRAHSAAKNVPKFQQPGTLFILQGTEKLSCPGNVHIVDPDHFMLTSAPIAFHIDTDAAVTKPLLSVHVAFDPATAMDIASEMEWQGGAISKPAAICQTSGRIDDSMKDFLYRLMTTLCDPLACRILIQGLIRELHFLLLQRDEGSAILAGLEGRGARGKVLKTTAELLDRRRVGISINTVAASAELGLSSYHSHFKALFGSTPLEYLKAARLHDARNLLRSRDVNIAAVGQAVGYKGTSQFSREFRRHFGRTAREERKLLEISKSNFDLV
ncbi:AraC family transcriptional regulator (plasmid) [Rhizobium sophoriradicis]|uniref:AraC family transcriptional regulator n=1 Tax=Rhizobium sophoriradicis TaxID=1535245 RepID=UPI00160CD221|nr:AraC family transcriptional regulator [Rhizobium leguminosarum bv. phaseoli]